MICKRKKKDHSILQEYLNFTNYSLPQINERSTMQKMGMLNLQKQAEYFP